MTRRARLVGVLAVLAAGAIGVIAATQTWLDVTLADGASDTLAVSGADAVPLLTPLSLAALAIGAALTIVGTVLRYILGALTLLIGGALAYVVGRIVFTQPVDAVAGAVTDATGIAGGAVASLVSGISETPWPVIALVAAVVLTLAGVFVLVTAGRWRESARRFRTDAAAAGHMPGEASAKPDAIDSWDELSRGEDPTA